MTPTQTTPDTIPDIMQALPKMLPELQRKILAGWLQIGLICLLTIGIFIGFRASGVSDIRAYLIPAVVAALIIGFVVKTVRRQHEAAIMPLLAQTAGLSYRQKAMDFANELPFRLLPKASRKSAEDLVSGTFGGRAIRFAEIKYETGGKNSTVLFAGVVAAFANASPMPPFFLASEQETKGWFIFKGNIKVDDLVHLQHLYGRGGRAYGVWGSGPDAVHHPGLKTMLSTLLDLGPALGPGAELYTASSNGQIMHVAIRHKRNLFQIGGLLATHTSLIAQIETAYRDLTMPLTIAAKLLAAEADAAKAATA